MEKKTKNNKEYEYIRGFSSISISGICKKLNVNRTNIMSGRGRYENFKLVKREIEKEIAKLYLGD